MQDRTDVPLRAGRHLHVHGVAKREREVKLKLLREEEHQKRRVKLAKHADASPRTHRARSRTSIEPRAKKMSNASPTERNAE